MEILLCVALFLISSLILYKLILEKKFQRKNLPPSPPKLPIIGHLHLLKGRPLHHVLHNLSNKYGSILLLHFGQRPVLVVSTPSSLEEIFTKNDVIFSNRPQFPSRKTLEYNFTSLGLAPYGNHWRSLRRFFVLEILSSIRLQMSSNIRMEEIQFLAKQLYCMDGVGKVNMKSFFYILTYNVVMRMIAGNRYFEEADFDSDEMKQRLNDMKQIFSPTMATPMGDFIPFLRWLPYFGAEKKMQKIQKRRDQFVQGLVDERRNILSSPSSEGKSKRTIIDVMLSLQESEPEFYTDEIIKGIELVMLIAGTDTSALTMEFAVSSLISHPDVLKKARAEIDANVEQSRLLDDTDLPKLSYLNCIINETLRLGPVGHIIPPRETLEDCTVGGFVIPRGTMLLVNAWATHRNPNEWVDPEIFKPERFEGNQGDKVGFKFIPFGGGRRICPGASLAMRLVALSLGTLIQCFEWEKVGEEPTPCGMEKDKLVEVIFQPRKNLVHALSHL